jgi:predicted  nucleic acid-binding Zn-ribbon protein
MIRPCTKCGFENTAATGSSMEGCPKCGAIYSKAVRGTAAPPLVASNTVSANVGKPQITLPLVPTILCAVCLVVGFFAGREQMRYQVASAMTNALAHTFDGMGKTAAVAPTTVTSAPVVAPPKEGTAAPPEPVADAGKGSVIAAVLLKKGFRDQNFSGGNYTKAAITFAVQFENTGNKDIRAFDGVLAFNDILGNRILASKLTISSPIAMGKSIKWDGELEYNQFESQHTTLRGFDMKDVSITLQVHKILFVDGTQKNENE